MAYTLSHQDLMLAAAAMTKFMNPNNKRIWKYSSP